MHHEISLRVSKWREITKRRLGIGLAVVRDVMICVMYQQLTRESTSDMTANELTLQQMSMMDDMEWEEEITGLPDAGMSIHITSS